MPDVLINNAGIVRGKLFVEHDQEADIALTMAINTLAPMHLTRELLPAMLQGGRAGRIVNIASAAGLVSNPRMSVYASSKWALIGWSDSLRLEAAGHSDRRDDSVPELHHDGDVRRGEGPSLHAAHGAGDGRRQGLASDAPRPPDPHDARDGARREGVWGLLPIRAWDVVGGRWFRIYHSMDEFTGR